MVKVELNIDEARVVIRALNELFIRIEEGQFVEHSVPKDKFVGALIAANSKVNASLDGYLETFKRSPEELTCTNCDIRDRCEFVDDPYNTDGDCLVAK